MEAEAQDTDAKTAASDGLSKVWERAIKRFDAVSLPQQEIRAHALECRRFVSIPGAMWEGPWGDQFANSIKVEVDKISKGVDKIITDYRENRIVPDFRPAGSDSDAETANTLDGIHRADSYHFKAQQARDNAFEEAVTGGFGAYRLTNQLSDPYDKDNDAQRINPGLTIVDADQRVYFDGNSKLYDKSDARFAFVITAMTREAFEEEYSGSATNFPDNASKVYYDWFMPDIVRIAEYYEKEDKSEDLLIFTHELTGDEQRVWRSDIEPEDVEEQKQLGYVLRVARRKRCRIHKYTMSGAEVLKDNGFIAGDRIPVVPVYGKRWFVDNQERFRGYVSKRMDSQRIYNGRVSKLAENDALSPREKPIFLAEQMPANLQALWAEQEINRHPYALVNPVIDANGNYVAMGPIGKIEPPQLPPVTAALLQLANNDLMEESEDGADEVKANTSAEAMDIAATRVDAKSGIYLDNMRQSVQLEGEIFLSMAKDVYYEPGRVVETMTDDGDDGEATLQEAFTDDRGRFAIRNDFTKGRYKVMASVTEATATRRDKTVKQMMQIAEVSVAAQDMEGAVAAVITATLNVDGEGTDDFVRFQRGRALKMGLVQPTEEEKTQMEAEAQAQPPDPTQVLTEAQAEALKAGATKDVELAKKAAADTEQSKAKTVEILSEAHATGIAGRIKKMLGVG